MDKMARGERNRSIRMLLAGGSALATVMVLGTQAANALVATPEELAALNGSSVNTVADGVARTSTGLDCGEFPAADSWAAGRFRELAAVGADDATASDDSAPQPSYGQLAHVGEAMTPVTLAAVHADAAGTPSVGDPDPVTEPRRAQRVREFDELAAVESAELDNMRGGFDMGGVVIQFGLELKNMLNGIVVDQIATINPAVISGGKLTNPGTFNVVSNNADGTPISNTTGGLPSGVIVNRSFNGSQTTMQFALNNGVMSLVQNAANNQNIQSLANLNLNISGLTSQLRSAMMGARALDALRSANRFRR